MLGSFDKQNEPIGYQEVADAVFQMKNNKTPGLDGISIDFYKIVFQKARQFNAPGHTCLL